MLLYLTLYSRISLLSLELVLSKMTEGDIFITIPETVEQLILKDLHA